MEFRSIARGLAAADAMLKKSFVRLLYSAVLCPGKYTVMVSGEVSAVRAAVLEGELMDDSSAISGTVITNLHPDIFPALSGTSPSKLKGSLGVIETIDAASAIECADTAAKAANVSLLEIRLSRGMGGKAFVFLCGGLSAVQTAVKASEKAAGKQGALIASSVIASPHRDLCY